MQAHLQFIRYFLGFVIISLAAYQISVFLQKKWKFPLITGLILIGIIAGNSFLHYLTDEAIEKLDFVLEISLAVIAFSAGAELHLDGLRSRFKSIKWMTIGQLVVTFVVSTLVIYYFSDFVPFMKNMTSLERLGVAMLFGTIFVARSPSSAVAIINEMRAYGPFTKTVMGVTVIKDVLVILLFSAVFAFMKNVSLGDDIDALFFILLIIEIFVSVLLGFIYGKLIEIILKLKANINVKSVITVLAGYSIYLLGDFLYARTEHIFRHPFEIEPLLTAIVAAFYVVNYTPFRFEFEEILERSLPLILVMFFTLTGATLSVQTLLSVIELALLFFLLRIFTLMLGGVFGVFMAGDPKKYYTVAWMPYITQAGVAVGLAALVGTAFPGWGHKFETIIIAIIVINQIVGPPLFKWALNFVHESHKKPKSLSPSEDGKRAVIFSLDNLSLALANKLKHKNWDVKIITTQKNNSANEIKVETIDDYTPLFLKNIDFKNIDTAILLHPDDRTNFRIAEFIYEHTPVKNIIAKVNSARFLNHLKRMKVKILEPMSAIVNMLEHTVRSPVGMELLLSEEENTDTIDVTVKNPDLVGAQIRDLKLPHDVIILSLKRRNNTVLPHGYTRLRKGDILTVLGKPESLNQIALKFEGE